MYTIASNEITSRIENYKALWGMWIEDAQSEAPVARECIHDADLYPYQPAAVETGGGSLSPCGYWLYCTAVQSDDGFKAGHWRRGQLNRKT